MPQLHLRETLHRWREEVQLRLYDLRDLLTDRREPLVPPRRLMFDGPRDPGLFKENGQEFLRYYLELCQLQPDERVLDLGSGIGRKTIPLISHLSPAGRYVGLDVNPKGIAWCRANIAARHANFVFDHIDVSNKRYNPRGTVSDSEYRFPFEDGSFDLVILASVFTHMLPPGFERYLQEVSRVLSPKTGRCLITYFLLDQESRAGIEAGRSACQFPFRWQHHAVEREHRPEDVVGYDEQYVRGMYERAGLEITAVYPGSWCGRTTFVSYQDMILAHKQRPGAS